jgi:hypothetical protein
MIQQKLSVCCLYLAQDGPRRWMDGKTVLIENDLAVNLYICFREMLGSNFGHNINYPERIFSLLSSISSTEFRQAAIIYKQFSTHHS